MKMEIKMEVVEEQRDSNPDGMEMEMEMEEQRDSNPDGVEMEEQRESNPGEMEMEERRDFSPDEVEMETDEQRDSNPDETEVDVNKLRDSNPGAAQMNVKKLRDLSPDEVVVLQALLELARGREGGHFASWGRRKRRSRGSLPSCKYDDSAAARVVAVMDAAVGVKPAQGSPTTPLRWSGNDKPSVSASAPASTSSDSAAGPGPRPCDRPLGPKLKFKVERKLGVHKPPPIGKGPIGKGPIGKGPIGKGPIGKGPKKKTLAELKELFIRLSSEKEEMEKEKEKLFNRFQLLSDKNMLLKRELELKLSTTGEPQLTVQSPTVSSDLRSPKVSIVADALDSSKNLVNNSSTAAAMGWYSSAEGILHCNDISWVGKSLQQDSLAPTKSLSHTFALPDLNMPAEDVEDLSDNQVIQTNSKAIVAAEARKYRRECLRLKHSQSVKVHAR